MAAVQHEPVAEKVVQFLPVPPPPPPYLVPPPSHSTLTLPLGLFTVDMLVFFSSSFLPLSNRLTKALPFCCFFPPLPVAHSSFLLWTPSLFPFKTDGFSCSSWCRVSPLPSLTPRLPPLLLPGQLFSSGSPRECRSCSSPPPPAGRAQEECMGALSLSLYLSHPRLSLHTVIREQFCGW